MWNWRKRDVKPLPRPRRQLEDLDLRNSTVSVRGPTEAVFLARLWDLMLCLSDSSRRERASKRSTNWTPPYCAPTDELVQDLVSRSWKELPPHLVPRLWAPLIDPSTGKLFPRASDKLNAVARSLHVRLPSAATELWDMKMNRQRVRFVIERRGVPLREIGCLPGLRIDTSSNVAVEILDPQGRVHCPHGPAVVHRDGTPEFYWRGTRVPSYFIPISDHWRVQYPGCDLLPLNISYRPLTAGEALRHPNTEIRRAACEIVGWHKILEDLSAWVVDRDKDPTIGELLRVRIPADFGEMEQQFLRVRCGTGRTFALAVPDTCRTALEANAWTYGLSPEDYKPEIRT